MYAIDIKPYGYHLTFAGIINRDEINHWLEESKQKLPKGPNTFSVFVDMRGLELLPVDSLQAMNEGQMYYKKMGMQRSVVIFSSNITEMQFKLIAKKTGIFSEERYIDAYNHHDWEQIGLDWILNGVEPPKLEKLPVK